MKKRDFSTAMGLISGISVIAISLFWGQNNITKTLLLFIDIPSIFIVIFGSFSAIIVAFQWDVIRSIPSVLHNAFLNKGQPKIEIIRLFIDLVNTERKNGLLSIEEQIDIIDDDFIKLGLHMAVDGCDEETMTATMELGMDKIEERHKKFIQVFRMEANLAPSFGMLGTFIGLILMMSNFQDMSKFSSAFATVLVTSFYGAVLSNLVFAPLANKLDLKNQEELSRLEMIMEGSLALRNGVSPRVLEDNLKLYLSTREKKKYDSIYKADHDNENKVINSAA
jgi:Flagellar motor component